MTYEEALKFLDEHCTASVIPFEVKAMCSQALEKQIPKKIIPVPEHIQRLAWISSCKCPNCKDSIEYDASYTYFCAYCGQAIDWGDEE